MSIRLHHDANSSSSWRVRIALALKGVPYESVIVSLSRGEHRELSYRALNPLGQVPCLEMAGRRVCQSMAIVELLEELYPDPALLPEEPVERAHAREIAQIVATGIQPLHNRGLNADLRRHFEARDDAIRAWSHDWLTRRLGELEIRLESGRGRYCVGDRISIADVFVLPQLHKAREYDVDLEQYARLSEIRAALWDEIAFASTAPHVIAA